MQNMNLPEIVAWSHDGLPFRLTDRSKLFEVSHVDDQPTSLDLVHGENFVSL
jgi:hypothetical protein